MSMCAAMATTTCPNGTRTPGESDTVRFSSGILPTDVQVTRDQSSYYLVLAETMVLVLDSMAAGECGRGGGRIEFDNGTVWT